MGGRRTKSLEARDQLRLMGRGGGILALTAAIWHNDHTGPLVLRSLTAYDH